MDEIINYRDDSVRIFIERWYHAPTRGMVPRSAQAVGVPHELAEWHSVASSLDVPITFQDYPVKLTELTVSDDGMMVFWVENQGGYFWAVDLNDEHRRVHVRSSDEEPWRATDESLGKFLLHSTVSEAILGAESRFGMLIPESVLTDWLMRRFVPLPFAARAHEDASTQLLCTHNALAKVQPPPTGYDLGNGPSRALTIAARKGDHAEQYGAELEPYYSSRPQPAPPPVVGSIADLPF